MPLASGITFPRIVCLELHRFWVIPDKECSLLQSLSYLFLCFVFCCDCDIAVCFSESAAPMAASYNTKNAYFFFFPSLLSGIIWPPFTCAWNITVGKIARLPPKTTLHRPLTNQMKEKVLVRICLMMKIKDSENCPCSDCSEHSNRSRTKYWQEGGMAKLA